MTQRVGVQVCRRSSRPEALVYQVNQVLRGWANYFCYGTYTSAFRSCITTSVAGSVGGYVGNLKLDGRDTSQYPDSYLERELGLLNITQSSRRHSVGEIMNLVREPDAGNPPVRFDEREVETEHGMRQVRHRQPKGPATAWLHLNNRATVRLYAHRDER